MLGHVLILWSCVAASHCYKILALPVSNSYSHFIVMEPLLQELAARGHQVTVVSSFPQKSPLPNYRDLDVGHLLEPVQSNLTFKMVLDMGKDPFSNMVTIWKAGGYICDKIIQSRDLQQLYNSSETYDLVISHIFAYDCFSIFAHKFNTPLISIVTSSALPWSNGRVGNPDHPAYVVINFINAHEEMTVYQRTMNSLAWLWSVTAVHYFSLSKSDDVIRKYLDPSAPSVQEVVQRTSLVMVNSHFSILQSRPFVPNFIEIGGIHMKDPKPLPRDLKEYLDSATDGVIIFSLGSLVRTSTMSNATMGALMDAFATLPQRVVFKCEEPVESPPNVLVRKWLPQRDLLEHPNVRLLMAHGGQSSTIEAVHSGIPLVGLPVFSDQYNNIQSLVLRGSAELLDIRDLTKDNILAVLNKVLTNPSYKLNAMKVSLQFRDRLAPPLQTAVYWTEYVLRHKGAPQLRSKVADLPWYQFLLLDVAAVLLLIVLTAYYVTKILVTSTVNSVLRMCTCKIKSKQQ